MPAQKMRSVRVEDEIWDAAQDRATDEDRSLSSVVRIALRAYAEGGIDAIRPPAGGKRK